ncbi:transketolase family protein [Halochromatium salexigens]|uniref:Transketolase n=1 Tax=Halochromatium salexigens TaxID=49447 RepID=A0AAJ0UCS4_HALSE|nr:transketolase C-terminal domain-containing protein [Halochromatium salexigens]MBK5929149.1 transketolase [Halochromatium salexigens]
MIELVTRPHRSNLLRWAAKRSEVLVLGADLTASCEADGFRDQFPERFFSFGMAEQNMLGFAAGLAREGFFPYIHTFSVFITRRPFDQLAMSIAYPNLPVRLIGFLPGLTTPGGVTHQAIDDIALMRALPNMTVLEAGDATEVESMLDAAQAIEGPVYVRQLRGEVPRLFPSEQPLRFGRARLLGSGTDLAVISAGICTEEALSAVAALRSRGVATSHLHVSTLKPFDDPRLLEQIANARYGAITIENHSIIGGLGSALAEQLAEQGIGRRLIRLGLRDTYAHGASKPYLMREYGLDARALVHAAETLIDASLGIDDAVLAEHAAAVRGAAQRETLAKADKTEDL